MLISVCMITYGHEKFINDALHGILMQETNFPIEIIVADDCSPDKTQEIVRRFIQHHPNGHLIKYTRHEQNKGMMNNFIWALQQCSGDYIAICEGDDYWTNELKLQKQVDFLEANSDYTICYHRVYELLPNDKKVLESINVSDTDKTFSILDLAKENFIHTPSVVFRNNLFEAFPVWFRESEVGDYVLHMLNARYGKIKYFSSIMAVYRRHVNGVWSTQSKKLIYEKWIKVLDYLLIEDFDDIVIEELRKQRRNCITIYLKIVLEGDKEQFVKCLHDFTQSDSFLEKEWLFLHYPQIIASLQSTVAGLQPSDESVKLSLFLRCVNRVNSYKKSIISPFIQSVLKG